jgi:DNA-binding transcriptional ArsR family regulator
MSLGDDSAGGAKPDRTAELRALAHPVRLRILSLLTGAPMTAAEVARELGLTHANASYHLRQLSGIGTIVIAGEERIRGGVAKRYRYNVDKDLRRSEPPPTGEAPTEDHRLFYAALASELTRRVAQLRRTGRSQLTDAELWVDPAVWLGIRDRIGAASTDLHLAAQPPRTPGTIRVSATIALFEMAASDE